MDLLNPAGSGGLSKTKLAAATAKASDVVKGKTFYAGDKTLQTGTLSPLKVTSGTVNWQFTNPETYSQTINAGIKPLYFYMQGYANVQRARGMVTIYIKADNLNYTDSCSTLMWILYGYMDENFSEHFRQSEWGKALSNPSQATFFADGRIVINTNNMSVDLSMLAMGKITKPYSWDCFGL